jgi:hypothetical protein
VLGLLAAGEQYKVVSTSHGGWQGSDAATGDLADFEFSRLINCCWAWQFPLGWDRALPFITEQCVLKGRQHDRHLN